MEASTLLGAVAVGLQLWSEDRGDVALRWANDAAPPAPAGEAAARAALAGEQVDAVQDGFRVRARRAHEGRVIVTFQAVTAVERLSASIIDSLQEGLIVIDMAGRVTRANQAAAALCGMALGELVGSPLSELPVELSRADGRPLEPDRSPVGVACYPRDGRGIDALLAAADRAMYARKSAAP